MASAEKTELKDEYTSILKSNPNFIVTQYQGLDVAQISSLRKKLREAGGSYTVVKNNVFSLALKESGVAKDFPYDSTLKGPNAIAFASEDVPSVAKVLRDFSKDNDKLKITAAVMESTYYDAKGVATIADLPSREQILAQLAAMLNSPATKIAGTLNNIMASMARGIKSVAEKNGQ
ncbi:MAG TPA: 50S ribosomal protein L10 [Turneriella sp.]|nr:50S ribosomal protein L10 [Turneriella sp.]HNA78481.1 50S ribosomal protein L10 [Turneriella sp.]HNE18965.1 50S ribosomal protein L10 [Turneriella sp.]HNJ64795.1 50S ribosomal protein L10 [Turneriella sp.]HNL08934.1 50S ribosomal protein L10 [Turneriella sp.]